MLIQPVCKFSEESCFFFAVPRLRLSCSFVFLETELTGVFALFVRAATRVVITGRGILLCAPCPMGDYAVSNFPFLLFVLIRIFFQLYSDLFSLKMSVYLIIGRNLRDDLTCVIYWYTVLTFLWNS